jgi:hypothetical protein
MLKAQNRVDGSEEIFAEQLGDSYDAQNKFTVNSIAFKIG